MERAWQRAAELIVEIIPLAIYAVVGSLLWVAAVSAYSGEKLGARGLFGIGIRNLLVASGAALVIPHWAPEATEGLILVSVLVVGFLGDMILFLGYWIVQRGKDDPVGTLKEVVRRWAGKGTK